jgi:hypothetical protein
MANQAFPSVNEHECSWADIAVNFNIPGGAEVPLVDLEAVSWGRTIERGKSRGTSGGRPMKKTAGSVDYEASITLTRSGHAMFMEALEAAALSVPELVRGDRVIISGVSFDIVVQHTPLGASRIYTAKISGCTYDGDSSDMSEGSEADTLEITLDPLEIATKSSSGNWIVLR